MKIGDPLVAKRVGIGSAFLYPDDLGAKPAGSDNLIGVGLAGLDSRQRESIARLKIIAQGATSVRID